MSEADLRPSERNIKLGRLAGVDVGGTFTDLAVWDQATGTISINKVLTTPDDLTEGIIRGLAAFSDVDAVVHGTTIVTNALIERRGVTTGMITTDGYRDVLEIGTELRYDPFDLFITRPEPLVPRSLRFAVAERVSTSGEPIVPLDEAGVLQAGRTLAAAGVKAIAVAFFNSYRNPSHELRAVEILEDAFPELAICASAVIAPEIREYERFSTAAANAYVLPLIGQYLTNLASTLSKPLFIMLSDGGIASAEAAGRIPIAMVESGPAAGAMAAARIASEANWPEVIAFDMGGTTAKVSLVHEGVPHRTHLMEVARVHRFKKGSGLPVRVPVIQLIEIGAGGGSIAAVDELGLLKVGPRSAGAVPGPACYGRGGGDATVTDADLHLGYLSAASFLGGRMELDAAAGEAALKRLGDRIGLGPTAAAAGITEIVDNNMATAARIHIAEQGRDPRRYRLMAFGGAGPVHAYSVARMLHIRELVFPRSAGVASAIGMLVAPRSVEYTRSLVAGLDDLDWDAVGSTIRDLDRQARELLREAHVEPSDITTEIFVDIRYVGQGFELTVPIDEKIVWRRDAAALHAAFEDAYRQRFDRVLPGIGAEAISWRLRALAAPVVTSFRLDSDQVAGLARTGERPVYFREFGKYVPTAVYDRSRLRPGERIGGPALIEELASTIVVGPSADVLVDPVGNLLMTVSATK